MKKIALAAAVALAFAGAAKADWVDYYYAGGGYTQSPDLGIDGVEFDMDYGFNVAGGVGWNQSEEVSLGLEVSYVSSEYDGTDARLDALGFMLNALYVCDTGDFWQPYFGGGVGAIQIRLDSKSAFLPLFSVAGSEWAFGYQGVAGINFPIDDTHGIFVGYRYQAAGDVDIEFLPDVEYASHNVMIGFVVSTN